MCDPVLKSLHEKKAYAEKQMYEALDHYAAEPAKSPEEPVFLGGLFTSYSPQHNVKTPAPLNGETPTSYAQQAGAATTGYVGIADSESLLSRLKREARTAGDGLTKKQRAIHILQRHPEFEEFLELLRLLPGGLIP